MYILANITKKQFQMHFLKWKYLHFKQNSIEICSCGLIDNKLALGEEVAWYQIGAKPLLQPMMTTLHNTT